MSKNRRYTLLFGFLGAIFISVGMLVKNIFVYSPTVGWIGALVFFLIASYFAIKANNECKKTT